MDKKLFAAVATLTGTIIGAGFLGIPYVVSRSGVLIGLTYLILFGLLLLFLKLALGEVVLRTKGIHQLTGYAYHYLGKTGKRIMLLSMVFGLYSALIAYLIGEGESFSFLFFGHTNYTLLFGFLFWIILSFFIYKGIRELKKGESYGFIFTVVLLLIIIAFFAWKVDFQNFTYSNPVLWFIPFGVVLFAYSGFSSMTEVERILKGKEKLMKKAIIIGTVIPIIFYILFTLVVVGVYGLQTPEVATLALGKVFVFLGIVTMFTSFFAIGLALEDMYIFDFNMRKRKAWAFTVFLPLILFLLIEITNFFGFTKLLSIGGSVGVGIAGILILLMYVQAKKKGNRKPEYTMKIPSLIKIILIILFIVGMLTEFF